MRRPLGKKEIEPLLALCEDEAAWIRKRQAVTPEALVVLIAMLRSSVCKSLKKESPQESEKFETAIGKIYASVDPKSADFALQLICARKKADSYVEEFLEYQKTPEASKVPGEPNWIQSPYNGKILDATGISPSGLLKNPSDGRIMRMPQ